MRIERVADLADLGSRAAGEILSVFRERQAAGGVPCLVLTGGRGGAQVLIGLRDHADRDTVDWKRVRLIWGDERWAPAGHADRNDLLADDSLLGAVETDPELVHRIAGPDSGLSLDEAAAQYAAIVDRIDRIDIAVNGVGEDGHVASIFPGRDDLLREDDSVPSAFAVRDSPKPPPERVSLSLPALRRAERVWLVAAGAGKAEALRDVLERADGADALPAERVSTGLDATLWADGAALGLVASAS